MRVEQDDIIGYDRQRKLSVIACSGLVQQGKPIHSKREAVREKVLESCTGLCSVTKSKQPSGVICLLLLQEKKINVEGH